GLTSEANPRFKPRDLPGGDTTYIGGLLTGTVSILPTPPPAALQALTKTAYSLTPYADASRLAPADAPVGSPIPRRVGDPSPIKHVFYVIRENRTYDQVLGDAARGNGDPALALFGAEVTPNAHALAAEFGLFDNFYVDAEVSYDGHAFSTGAYATDVVEKFWPTNYAHRGAAYLSEGGGQMRNAYGNLAAPENGYIWDACVRAGKTVRSYGEFVYPNKEHQNVAQVPGLEGRIDPDYAPFNLDITDQQRADEWLRDFTALDAKGAVPALSVIRLPDDHTAGTRPGSHTPRAMVADNDLALGRIVEAISSSRVWKESAIFVVEDDAQNGPDHVDAHRSVLLAISSFARRRAVDSTLYTTSGVLRTIELVLGLPPMSQYDAAATPMYAAFQATPALTPFTHLAARIPLDEKNDWTSYGARASLQMDLSQPDLAPERELNEILWRSIKGADSSMPPIVRSAWVRRHAAGRDGDDDR
ncbi:MAG: alkaline phosphatase family protein, partial [Betaproteobacteria bacterium]